MKTKKAFSLTEVLTVISIIGILSSVVIVNVSKARQKSKDRAVFAQIMSTQPIAYKCIRSGILNPAGTATTRLYFSLNGIGSSADSLCGYNVSGVAIAVPGFPTWPDIKKTSSEFDFTGFQYSWCKANSPLSSIPTTCSSYTSAATNDTTAIGSVCGGKASFGKFCYAFGSTDVAFPDGSAVSLTGTQKVVFCTQDGCSACTSSGCSTKGF